MIKLRRKLSKFYKVQAKDAHVNKDLKNNIHLIGKMMTITGCSVLTEELLSFWPMGFY